MTAQLGIPDSLLNPLFLHQPLYLLAVISLEIPLFSELLHARPLPLTLTPKSLKVSLILHIDICSLHPSPLYSLRGPVFPEPLAGIGVRWKKMPASLRRTLPSGMECGTEDEWIANGRPKSSPGPRDQRKGRYKGQA